VKLGDDRVTHLSHAITEALADDERVHFVQDWNKVRLTVRRTIAAVLKQEEEIVAAVEARIRSIKRNLPEGGAEWEALFRNYYGEEIDKLRSIR